MLIDLDRLKMDGACCDQVYRGYSDNTMTNLAMYIQINHVYLQNALEMLSEGPKIQKFPGKRVSSTCAKCAHIGASTTPGCLLSP